MNACVGFGIGIFPYFVKPYPTLLTILYWSKSWKKVCKSSFQLCERLLLLLFEKEAVLIMCNFLGYHLIFQGKWHDRTSQNRDDHVIHHRVADRLWIGWLQVSDHVTFLPSSLNTFGKWYHCCCCLDVLKCVLCVINVWFLFEFLRKTGFEKYFAFMYVLQEVNVLSFT